MLASAPAAAHLPVLRGKLLELVQRSDLIVIGTADRVVPVGTSLVDTTVTIAQVLAGATDGEAAHVSGSDAFRAGGALRVLPASHAERFRRQQDAGTVFPCTPADDAIYRSTIQGLSRALRSDLATRPDAVRAALLPALGAQPAPLRYHAALELRALAQAGHPPNAAERARIEQLLRDPSTDPALQPLLQALVRPAAPGVVHTPAPE